MGSLSPVSQYILDDIDDIVESAITRELPPEEGTNESNEEIVNANITANADFRWTFNTCPTLESREVNADSSLQLAYNYLSDNRLYEVNRIPWSILLNRLSDVPRPTESSSGTISVQEQIEYSERQNPRHWNIVKVRFNNRTSGRYLSYLIPPSLTIESDIRIASGAMVSQNPSAFEICVYNTPEYWKELRHMIHQDVDLMHEVAAA